MVNWEKSKDGWEWELSRWIVISENLNNLAWIFGELLSIYRGIRQIDQLQGQFCLPSLTF